MNANPNLILCAVNWAAAAQVLINPGDVIVDTGETNRPPTLEVRVGPDGRLGIRGDF